MSVRWLHLSDLRVGPEPTAAAEALPATIASYRTRGLAVDLILVSGDLVAAPKADCFAALGELLDELLDAAGLTRDRLFVVPGDGDSKAPPGLSRSLKSQSDSDAYFGASAPGFHFTKLAAFRRWHDAYFEERSWPKAGTCALHLVELEGARVAVLTLDSSLFATGKADDGQLWIGRRCLDEALAEEPAAVEQADLRVALMHHRLAALHDDERGEIAARLEGVELRLHGAELAKDDGAGALAELEDGRLALATRRGADEPGPSFALIGSLDAGEVFVRVLRADAAGEWSEDPEAWLAPADADGSFSLAEGGAGTASSSEGAKAEPKTDAEPSDEAKAEPEAEASTEADAEPSDEAKAKPEASADAEPKAEAKPEDEADEVPAVEASAEEKAPSKASGAARWVVPLILGVVAIAALIAYLMSGGKEERVDDPSTVPKVQDDAPDLVQCLALAKAGKYEFQKGLDIDSNSLDAFAQKLGIKQSELIEAAQNPEVDKDIVAACQAQFGTASAAALSVVSASGVPVQGASVTVKGGYGFAKGCSTDAAGSCTITIPTVLEPKAPLVLAALAEGKRARLDTTVSELKSKPIELRLDTTLAKCTIEVLERPGGAKLLDLERVEIALDEAAAPIQAEEGGGADKGTWSFECSDRAELGAGKVRVTRAGVPKEFAFESVELTTTLTWAGSGGSGGSGSGGSGGDTPPPPPDCADDSNTKKMIRAAIHSKQAEDPNRVCGSVTVTISGRRIVKANPSWLKGVTLGSAALSSCTGTIKCP